jgi:hypothetical protein
MKIQIRHSAVIGLICFASGAFGGQGFSFSKEDEAAKAQTQAQAQARGQAILEQLATPCRPQLKGKKIMLMIGERVSGGGISAQQSNYGLHFQAINQRLRSLGLQTYTPEEIKRQIAQAEIDAYFKGNPDAALSASRRLGASFVLRGLITAEARVNPVIRVNEVTVDMAFALSEASGRLISNAAAEGGSYAGSDVRSTAARLINEQADEVVAQLYSDYCSKGGTGQKRTR